MLPRSKRLRSQEVAQVLAHGRSARLHGLSAKFLPTEEPLRSAAVVPKSLVRKANKRNTLRRAMYRALEKVTQPQGQAVFLLRAMPKDSASLREEFIQLLHKL